MEGGSGEGRREGAAREGAGGRLIRWISLDYMTTVPGSQASVLRAGRQ